MSSVQIRYPASESECRSPYPTHHHQHLKRWKSRHCRFQTAREPFSPPLWRTINVLTLRKPKTAKFSLFLTMVNFLPGRRSKVRTGRSSYLVLNLCQINHRINLLLLCHPTSSPQWGCEKSESGPCLGKWGPISPSTVKYTYIAWLFPNTLIAKGGNYIFIAYVQPVRSP